MHVTIVCPGFIEMRFIFLNRNTHPIVTNVTSQNHDMYSTITCDGWERHVGQCTTRNNTNCTHKAAVNCFGKCTITHTLARRHRLKTVVFTLPVLALWDSRGGHMHGFYRSYTLFILHVLTRDDCSNVDSPRITRFTSFFTTDEQLQLNRGCCFLVQAMLPEGFSFHRFNF